MVRRWDQFLSTCGPALFFTALLCSLFAPARARDIDLYSGCIPISSWEDISSLINRLPQGTRAVVLCPFDIVHDGTSTDGLELYTEKLTLSCAAENGALARKDNRCRIRGSARHFNIAAEEITLLGFSFEGSNNAAVWVNKFVTRSTITRCVFSNNLRSIGEGAAVVLERGSQGTTLDECEFNGNVAWGGGAVSGVGASLTVVGCTFRDNRATIGAGGAIKLVDDFQLTSRINNGGRYRRRNLKHKSNTSVSSLIIESTSFVSNSAALAGPAVYLETDPTLNPSSGLISLSLSGTNYGCANLAVSRNIYCNGIADDEGNCEEFRSICYSDMPNRSQSDAIFEGKSSGPRVGTTGESDDRYPGNCRGGGDECYGNDCCIGFVCSRRNNGQCIPDQRLTGGTVPVTPPLADGEPSSQSPAPSKLCSMGPVERHDAMIATLEDVSEAVQLRRASTPQGKAVEWLLYEDELQLCPNDPNIVQRYVLAVLYFSTGGETAWKTCSRRKDLSNPCEGKRFLSSTHECRWAGVGCSGRMGSVSTIAFENNGLIGTVPKELGHLRMLRTLRMEQGELSGSLPASLGDLSRLEKLDLDSNHLTGTLPKSLSRAKELRVIDLNQNSLTGNLDVLASLPSLFFVQLQDNSFTGTIHAAIGSLGNLQVFSIQNNGLTGNIAVGFCDLRINGNLQFLQADCTPGIGSVSCVCCSHCFPDSNKDGTSLGSGASLLDSLAGRPTKAPTALPRPEWVPSRAPTRVAADAPTTFTPAQVSIFNAIISMGIATRSVITSEGTAQHRAAMFLVNDDELRLSPGDARLGQRYLAAVFYYSTGGDWWLDRGSGDGAFLGPASECSWKGLRCNAFGEVTSIEFEKNGLRGTIPDEIVHFDRLEVLGLERGELGGTIPQNIGQLQSLRELDLDFNLLTGPLPPSLGAAPQLGVIDLNSNQLTGGLGVLARADGAYFIQVHGNHLTGTVPQSLGQSGGLQVLTLQKNELVGRMPSPVCDRLSVYGGHINQIWADCGGANPKIECSCCSKCFED